MPTSYDAIVVGSGISGGWAAKELTEHGLRTLVLEAGRPIDPATDYTMSIQPWQLKYHGRRDRDLLDRKHSVQQRCYACDAWSEQFFVDDSENPYTTPDGQPFDWIRGRQVGGRSIMWGRQVYRWSDLDFEANAKDGFGTDWPIRYADIAPWYDYVERYIGISGNAENLPQLPDGRFLPGMPLNVAEQYVRDRLLARYPSRERVVTIGRCAILTENHRGRAAILTQDHRGRAACGYCGQCERGCSTFSYFNSVHVTLPAAQATGKLTLRPFSVVHSIMYDPRTGKASGVRVIDANTNEVIEFRARLVFLNASALESTRILLNSTSERWPNGLANSSGVLGKYLMDHWMGAGADGTVPGFENKTTSGSRPNGVYLPRFRNVTTSQPGFLRGYAYQGGGGRGGWGRGVPGFGRQLKEALRTPGPWNFDLYGFGECLPRETNFIELDPAVKDKWGIPALRIHCKWSDNERAAARDASQQAAEMLEAAGLRDINPYVNDNAPGLTIHEMGTARMGKDPHTSVLNGFNQAWDVPNLFCTDGACMASTANQNPSITYMALTARAVDHAVSLMRRREI